MKEFVAKTNVKADIATGWHVLTNFAQYSEWNPLLRNVDGKIAVNASLRLRIAKTLGSDKTMFLPAKVRVVKNPTELAWGGGVPGLLDVHHYFRFEPNADGFRFVHGETFRGVLLPLLWPIIGARVLLENYEAVNEAFKVRCEQIGKGR